MGAHKKITLLKDKDGIVDTHRASQDSLLESEDADLTLEIPIDDPSQIVLHKEMLQSSQSDLKDIQFSNEFLDFGFTDHNRLSESKQLTVHNKFAFPVRVDWALLPVIDKTTGKEFKNPFSVRPAQQEIAGNGNFVFEVDFAPYEPDSYFFQMAQCFVHLKNGNHFKTKMLVSQQPIGDQGYQTTKSIRSQKTATKTLLGSIKQSKYVDFSAEEIDPPQSLTVRLMGHSFAPGSQPFIPMIKLSQNKIAMQACSAGESVYETVQLSNTSDTPV